VTAGGSEHPLVDPFERIIAIEDSASRRGPSAEWNRAKAREYVRAGLGDSAIDELLAASKLDPESPDTWLALAEIYEAKARYWPALHAVRKALELDANNRDATETVARLVDRW